MEQRGQFTFYSSVFESARRIRNKAARAEFYDAICAYALNGIEPDLDKLSDAAAIGFISAKPNLDASRKKAKSGKAGGSAKQTGSKPEANGKQTGSEKEKEKEKEKEYECTRARVCFDDFWEQYPHQVGRETAIEVWESMEVTPETMQQILDGLDRWKRSLEWAKDGGQYIPRPVKWLSEKRWLEHPIEATPKGASGQLGSAEMEAIQQVLREGKS